MYERGQCSEEQSSQEGSTTATQTSPRDLLSNLHASGGGCRPRWGCWGAWEWGLEWYRECWGTEVLGATEEWYKSKDERRQERQKKGRREREKEGRQERKKEGRQERQKEGRQEREKEGRQERQKEGRQERDNKGQQESGIEGIQGGRNQAAPHQTCPNHTLLLFNNK
ncbi:hypothetical protein Pcinc_027582 [Petrolisthes cinctipes]|uniref:Uncharacterized protein n=1 Tax=Petrolisthes cinctipes TaxID=88211 RepID=A0AAE1K6M3_PETCI|nr:hypothetical protein Pcinc_027582 [Petrolisthes cinctipes]